MRDAKLPSFGIIPGLLKSAFGADNTYEVFLVAKIIHVWFHEWFLIKFIRGCIYHKEI